ncbi:MAG: DUF938 domain-containing protein [Myxococcota bacterium]
MNEDRLDFPATSRNRDALVDVLSGRLPKEGRLLEVASGSGQHVAWFATRWPGVTFVPSDPDPRHRASIAAWTDELPNVEAPIDLDVLRSPWAIDLVDFVFCANMIHISPFACTEALIANAATVLSPAGRLWLYGPFVQADVETAPSNLAFDASLRERNPAWGIRHLDEVTALSDQAGLTRTDVVAMPANNLFVAFERR